MSVRQLIKRGLARYDIAITRYNKLKRLERDSGAAEALRFMREMPRQQLPSLIEYIDQFKSQNRQDLFALCENGFKRNGYFVEFGATDGVNGSNSYLLEKSFGWQGIVAEPARCWHAQLRANRSCAIDTACVWTTSGQTLVFNEVPTSPALSTIKAFSDTDHFSKERRTGVTYEVPTISLLDLLQTHNAPREIDFLSIDTEGSELEILRSFDFSQYQIRTISCEHNFTPAREEIYSLLTAKGYQRRYESLSSMDDWYVLAPPAR